MDKSNVFKSSNFFMSEGDILHMIIIDEAGVPMTVDLQTTPKPGEVINVVPGQVVAKAATAITSSSFTANWNLMENATGYYLDVATDSAFTSMILTNHNAGNSISHSVTGLNQSYVYYYRVRGYNDIGTGMDSETITTTTFHFVASDWFLPSKDELNEINTELYLHGVGGLSIYFYWSSSEGTSDWAWNQRIGYGTQYDDIKSAPYSVRACRAFTSTRVYNLRDIGPAGGYIFWKSGNNYLEAAPTDQHPSYVWSNIDNVAIGVTAQGTAIGTGQANTTAIINQVGHTNSAAKLCNDLIT